MAKEITMEQLHAGDMSHKLLLDWPFEFNIDIGPEYTEADWFTLDPPADSTVIGRGGSGGIYLHYGQDNVVVYVSSEGQAGVIAASLTDAIHLFVGLPNWRDVLGFSGGGDLEEMERAAVAFPPEEDVSDDQKKIYKWLGIKPRKNLIQKLHKSVSESDQIVTISGKDGTRFQSLFNEYTAPK